MFPPGVVPHVVHEPAAGVQYRGGTDGHAASGVGTRPGPGGSTRCDRSPSPGLGRPERTGRAAGARRARRTRGDGYHQLHPLTASCVSLALIAQRARW